MRRILLIMLAGVWISPALATIINIPADYPTIQQGIDASSDADTVLVQPGTYVENINFNGHNIVLGSLFLTTGDTSYISQTVIDGDSAGTAVTFESEEDSTTVITGFNIKKGYAEYGGGGICCTGPSAPLIKNNIIIENHADIAGGGIWCYGSSATIVSNFIGYNSSPHGGGITYEDCHGGIMINCVLIGNTASNWGGGIECWMQAEPIIKNSIICLNADDGIFSWNSLPEFINSIIRNNGINVAGEWPILEYSNIEGGWEGEGNIDADPLFRDPDNGDFHLMSTACGDPYNSPCIDAGHPDILDSLLDCSWGLGELRSDMGAYGGGDSATVAIEDFRDRLPSRFALVQNYPNPFNSSTVIRYSLPKQSNVRIKIYSILGQRVATLFEGIEQPGYHAVPWQADDYPSGVYFAKLSAGERIENIKMVLLK